MSIRGSQSYSVSGPVTSGGVTTWGAKGGQVSYVSASLDGPRGGSARVGGYVYSIPWLDVSVGRIGVLDRSSGLELVLPFFGPVESVDNTISGVARGLERIPSFPFFAPVELSWSFTDNG
jgi:hypothetical protein